MAACFHCRNIIEDRERERRAVIWESRSKGVAFLTTLQIKDEFSCAVDINLRKQGTFLAGAGHKIVSPDFLRTYHPEVVIIMNTNYKDEIRQQLCDLGITARIMTA